MLGVPPAHNAKALARFRVGDSELSAPIPLTTAGTKGVISVRREPRVSRLHSHAVFAARVWCSSLANALFAPASNGL
jgi:hypothetical protein